MKSEIQLKCEAKRLVFVHGEGPTNAKIMIVGESLGAEEERLGRPFVGGAGQLLENVLTQTHISRGDVYITNLVKVRPPKNEIKLLGELGLRVEEFIPLLKAEIERVRPNVVVALGNEALGVLTSLYGIMKWRGSIVESTLVKGQKVIGSVHPAAILRNYKWKALLMIDMKRVREESKTREIKLPERASLIEPSFDEVRRTFDLLDKGEKVSFDIEIDKDNLISCLGLSSSVDWAISIPFRKGYQSYWTEGEEYVVWKMIRDFFHSGKLFIAQNALFDMKFLVPKLGYFDCYMDTMWAHQLIYAEIPKGLDTLCSIYTRETYYKDARKVWKDLSLSKQLWLYNVKDAFVTLEVALRLEEELKEHRLEEFFFGFVMKLLPVLLMIEMRGMKISMEKKSEIEKELREREKILSEEIGVNVNSPKALAKYLYEDLKFPKQMHHKRGNVTTNKEALIKLRSKVR